MRFTLRFLLLALALLAFLAAVCFAFPVWLANVVMAPLPLILPGVYTVGLIYGPKMMRPFFIGALGPFVMVMFSAGATFAQAHTFYLPAFESFYSHTGEPREFVEAKATSYGVVTGAFYLQMTFLLLCSLIAGFLCLGLRSLLWKESNEE